MPAKLRAVTSGETLDLSYFIEWRSWLWAPAVRWLIGDPNRFMGKRLLELGCRSGRMSCLFALFGAEVTGVELEQVSLEKAHQEADLWGLSEKVSFIHYNGNPLNLPDRQFDFVFTKSVLVIIPELSVFLSSLAQRLSPGCELLLAENRAGGELINFIRRHIIRQHWNPKRRFHPLFKGVNQDFLSKLESSYKIIAMRNYFGIVAAIRANRSPV